MRWKVNELPLPHAGDTRICSGYTFAPKEIDGEVRQFEFVKWEEEYVNSDGASFWMEKRWIDLDGFESGDTRIRQGFTFLPKTIKGYYTSENAPDITKHFKWVKWEEMVMCSYSDKHGYDNKLWVPIKWL